MIINVNNENELKKLNQNIDKPFCMWFYADWCGHCKAMESEWHKLENKCKGKYNLARVRDDFKDHVNGGVGMNVNGFPKIIALKNGRELNEFQGDRSVDSLMNFIKNNNLSESKPKKRKVSVRLSLRPKRSRSMKMPRRSRRMPRRSRRMPRRSRRCGRCGRKRSRRLLNMRN